MAVQMLITMISKSSMSIKAYYVASCFLCVLIVWINNAVGGETTNEGLDMINHAEATDCIYRLSRSPENGLVRKRCKTVKNSGNLLVDGTCVYEAIRSEKATGVYECKNFIVIVIHCKNADDNNIAFIKCDAMLEVTNQLRTVFLLPDKMKYSFTKIQDYLDEEGMVYDYVVAINKEELFKQENKK